MQPCFLGVFQTFPDLCRKYYRNQEDTKKSFGKYGLKTGDICHVDKDGYVYIIDRKKDLIDVSGYKVVPAEVENTIRTVKSVEDVVVVGEKDSTVSNVISGLNLYVRAIDAPASMVSDMPNISPVM